MSASSKDPSQEAVRKLFAAFVKLRESGKSREEALKQIAGHVQKLPAQDQQRLKELLRKWEARRFQVAEEAAPNVQTPIQTLSSQQAVKDTPAQPSEESVIRRINSRAESEPVYGTAQSDTGELPKLSRFEAEDSLYLMMMDTQQQIRVPLSAHDLILGRKESDSPMLPDIDLAPYQAAEYGVSRLHASLKRRRQNIVITDLGSTNYTFVNGERLQPHEARELHDGDEIKLARMPLRVIFRSE